MTNHVSKADLHAHSLFSKRPSEWILRKIGCAESYTPPKKLYDLAKRKGMDFVTITDHNTIQGCLEIADLENVFISEEITTYFPEDGCKLHVLAFDITEAQHGEIGRLRRNVFELVSYLRQERIVHALAHPLYSINDLLKIRHVEMTLLLFQVFEVNGSRSPLQNRVLVDILSHLGPGDMEVMAERTGLPLPDSEPWKKFLIGGSDDHSSLNIGRICTAVPRAEDVKSFLKGIFTEGVSIPGSASSPRTLAHSVYGIAYQFYRSKFKLDRFASLEPSLRFAHCALTGECPPPETGLLGRIRQRVGARKQHHPFDAHNAQDLLLADAGEIILRHPDMKELLEKGPSRPKALDDIWFSFVNEALNAVMARLCDSILQSLPGVNLFDIFHSLGSVASLYTMLSPYFVSYAMFSKDRRFCADCLAHFDVGDNPLPGDRVKVAHFTDTFLDINGVALTLQQHAALAVAQNREQIIVTCGPPIQEPGVKNFTPVGAFDLPEYGEMNLYYPPLLEILQYCYEGKFTRIHAATPGPVGLVALAVARILKLPIFGTYHTAMPQYTATLTEDLSMGEFMWKYIIWYYGQMDLVYVPSRATGDELLSRGIPKEKIQTYPRGIDTEAFHPAKRNGFVERHYGIGDETVKLLYVGRVSREKDLPLLVELLGKLTPLRANLHLLVVGEGPYLQEMKAAMKDLPATFPGYLHGEDLSLVYASCDIFLFPSTTDTFGNVVLEAQSSGLPVIVSDKGGPRENILPGKTGLVAPAGNLEAFLKATLELIDSPARRREMGQNARAYMEGRSFEAAYRELWKSYAAHEGSNGQSAFKKAA